MLCANSDCSRDIFDQPGGSLWQMELELCWGRSFEGEDNGFPICTQPMKCFWLCVQCSQKFVLQRWTPAGIVLAPVSRLIEHRAADTADRASKPPVRVHASASFEADF